MALSGSLPKTYARSGALSEAALAELQDCKQGIEVSCVRSECNPATSWPFFKKYGPHLRGGEPMSNHDCGVFVRHAIERLPPQCSLSAGSADVALPTSAPLCPSGLRIIARRSRWPIERSLRAREPCAYSSRGGAL